MSTMFVGCVRLNKCNIIVFCSLQLCNLYYPSYPFSDNYIVLEFSFRHTYLMAVQVLVLVLIQLDRTWLQHLLMLL